MNQEFNFFKLSDREAKTVTAGERVCGCGCAYANCGGSSTQDNFFMNSQYGLISKHFEPQC